MENYYRALNIASTATEEEIKKVILRDRRLWSNRTNLPDLEKRQEAERMVKLLVAAEQTLLNPVSRQQYDQQLRTAPVEQPQTNQAQTGEQHDWIREGRRFLSNGDIPSALYAATQATQTMGNDPEAWALSAQVKFRWGQPQDSIYEYKRAIGIRPNEAMYYFDLGSVYESIEDWNDALQHYQWASKIEPASTMYRASIGEMYFNLDRYQEAITTLKQCVAEEPDNRVYREYLALAYCAGSYEHWTYVPANNPIGLDEDHYATTKFQVDEALASVQKAQALELQTPEVKELVQSIHVNIQSMLKRHFHGNWFAAGLATLLGVFLLVGNPFWGLLYIICGVGYAVSCFMPQYLVNRRIIEGKALGGSVLWNIFVEGGVGCGGMIIALVIIMLTLPIVMVVNFLRNWVLAPQPTATERQRLAKMQPSQPQVMPEIVINQQQRS